jgi:hypothetical protein
MLAVVAAALAIWGRTMAPAAASPIEACNSERLVSWFMAFSLVGARGH